MKILLVSATILEIRPLLGKLEFIQRESEFLEQYRNGKTLIDVLLPGIGMTATAYHLGRQLASSRYDMAFNTGICGSYSKSLPVGSVVQVVRERFSEMGAEEKDQFITVFDMGLMDKDKLPFWGGILMPVPVNGSETLDKVIKVQGNTVNTIHGNRSSIERVKSFFPADVETMEGAAFVYGCLSENIPCAQIRSVSNFVDERSLAEWNITLAVNNLNKTMKRIFEEIVH